MKKRKEFTKEFKLSILNELCLKKAAQVCKEQGIHPVMISRWKKEFNQDPAKAFSGRGNLWKTKTEVEKIQRTSDRGNEREVCKMIEEANISLAKACSNLKMSRSSYYNWKTKEEPKDADKHIR